MDVQLTRQRVIELVQKYHYPIAVNDLLPSIRLKTVPKPEERMALGETKIGGSPDLPAGMSWPEWQGRSLPFLAQIRLSDLTHYGSNKLLPQSGILYFFFDIDLLFSAPHASYWKVLYSNDPSIPLHRTSLPHPAPVPYEDLVMPSCAVEFSLEITIPPFASLFTRDLELEEDYFELLEEVEHLYDPSQRPAIHRILGHPNAIQGDMQVKAQQRWLQQNPGVLSKQDFEAEAKKWLLLLQISWDENLKRDWADSGRLYYWIRPEDLDARRFESVQFFLQSY